MSVPPLKEGYVRKGGRNPMPKDTTRPDPPGHHAEQWRTDIENAPKDGSDVLFPIEFIARAYWCKDLERWVLTRPLHMESIYNPAKFRLPKMPR